MSKKFHVVAIHSGNGKLYMQWCNNTTLTNDLKKAYQFSSYSEAEKTIYRVIRQCDRKLCFIEEIELEVI